MGGSVYLEVVLWVCSASVAVICDILIPSEGFGW